MAKDRGRKRELVRGRIRKHSREKNCQFHTLPSFLSRMYNKLTEAHILFYCASEKSQTGSKKRTRVIRKGIESERKTKEQKKRTREQQKFGKKERKRELKKIKNKRKRRKMRKN